MKIAIIGSGTIGLAAAAHCVSLFAQHGIEAEARQATPEEEVHCMPVEVEVFHRREVVGMEPVFAFEPPRFNGYMNQRGRRKPDKMYLKKWR